MFDGQSGRRRRRLGGALLVGVAAWVGAACSGGGSGAASNPGGVAAGASENRATCALLERLPHTADALASVPLSDPARFDAAMRTAVTAYMHTLDEIAPRVPATLRRQVEVLRSAVQQRKFADAQAARAPLDDWAADHC